MKLGLKLQLNNRHKSSGSSVFLLDEYPGAAAAYSLIALSSDWVGQPVIRVRRSSDNAEQNFTETEITNGTLVAFCGVGNGFVTTWYDQSGNIKNVIKDVTTNQPKIVSDGVLIIQNGLPAIQFDGINDELIQTSIEGKSLFAVAQNSELNTANYVIGINIGGISWGGTSGSVPGIFGFDGFNAVKSTVEDFNEHLGVMMFGTSSLYVDGVLKNIGSTASSITGILAIGSRNSFLYHKGYIKAAIIYSTDQSANRVAIETIINNTYSIY